MVNNLTLNKFTNTSSDDSDVKKKYENLNKILDEAIRAVEGLAAVDKQIKKEFEL